MKKISLIFSLLFIGFNLFSQITNNSKVALYSFEEVSGTYQSINSSETAIIPSSWDDGCSAPINIGFDFIYNNLTFNQFTVNTNGTVNLGNTTISQSTNNLASATLFNLLAPLWDDLIFLNSGVGEGLFYLLEGTVGNQILTIEFYNVGRYDVTGISTGKVSFQVKLFESDNNIEFIYGDLTGASDWSVNSTTSIGINGKTDVNTVFLSVTPNSVSGATVSSLSENNSILKSDLITFSIGTTYRFTPPEFSDNFDISITNINLPVANILENDEVVNITLANLGKEITSGLILNYEFFDLVSNSVVASISEDYNISESYPIVQGSLTNYEFASKVDLSANSNYELTVTATLTDDINTLNNQKIQIIKGVIIGDVIFDNAQLITHPNAGFGNANVSAVQQDLGMVYYGDNSSNLIGYRNADDFVIPENQEWTISGFGFYNFQTGSTLESTITYADFKIWKDNIADGNLLYDFTQNNMLSGSIWSGIYRTASTALLNTERPIMHNICNFETGEQITLQAGTYWIDYSCEGTLMSGPYQPYVSILGESVTGNAMHFGELGWVPMTDDLPGTNQGMPFEVYKNKTITNITDKNINDNNSVKIYPNPCNQYFKIISEDNNYQLNVYDISGKKVLTEKVIDFEKNINTSNLLQGIYFVEILNSENITIQKIIIQ